jgi:hypothetical protein
MTSTIITAVVFVFVAGVLALAAYALYECTPLAHRDNPYRDGATGKHSESPHVDEFRDFS